MAHGSLVTRLGADLRPLEQGLDRALQKLRDYHREAQRLAVAPTTGAPGTGRLTTIGGRPVDPVRAGAEEFRARQANLMQQVRFSQALAAQDEQARQAKRRDNQREEREQEQRRARELSSIRRDAQERARLATQQVNEAGRAAVRQVEIERRARRDAEREVGQLFRPTERIAGASTLGESLRAAGLRPPGGGGGGGLTPRGVRETAGAIKNELNDALRHTFGILQSLNLAVGVGTVGGVGAVIAQGFKLNKEFDRFRITMAASLGLTHDVVDAQGNLVTGQARVNALLAETPKLFQVIRKIANETLLEQGELIETVTQNLAFAKQAGFQVATPEQFERTARTIASISQLARAVGLPGGQRQLAQETRALFLGERLQGAQIAQLLGFRSAAEIQRLQQSPGRGGAPNAFINELEKRLKDVDPILKQFRDSFEGVTTTLISQSKEFLRLATLPAFQKVTSFFQQLRDSLGQNVIEDAARGIGEALGDLTQSFINFAKSPEVAFVARILRGELTREVDRTRGISRFLGAATTGDLGNAFATGPTARAGERLTQVSATEANARELAVQQRAQAQRFRAAAAALRARGEAARFDAEGNRILPGRVTPEQFELRAGQLEAELPESRRRAAQLAGIRLRGRAPQLDPAKLRENLEAQAALARAQQQQRAALVLEANLRAQQVRETVKSEDARRTQIRAIRLTLNRELRQLEEDQAQSLKEARAKAAADELAGLQARHERELTELRRQFVNERDLREREALLRQQQARERRGFLLEREQAALGFQGQAAGLRGQVLRGINLQAQQEVNTVRQAINARRIEEQSGLRLIQSIRDDADRKRLQSIRENNDQAVDLVQQFNSLVQRRAELQRGYEEGLLALRERMADRERNLARARVQNERELTEALRQQARAREDLTLGREERSIRAGLASELGRSTFQGFGFETSFQDRLQRRFVGRTRRELPGLESEQVTQLAAQRTQEFLRSLIDTLLGPEGLQQAVAQLRGVGLDIGQVEQQQLAGFAVRAGALRGRRATAEEARTIEDLPRAEEEARRRVTDVRQAAADLEREDTRARRDELRDRRQLEEGLRVGLRETSLEFTRLAAATREFLDVLKRAGINVPAATAAALGRALPGGARRTAAEAALAGAVATGRTTPTTGLVGPPIPRGRPAVFGSEGGAVSGLGIQVAPETRGSFEVFAPGRFGAPETSLGALAERAMATGIINVGGEADRIIENLFPGSRGSSAPVNQGGGTVINLAGMNIGADTRQVLEELAKKLERDARRTPAP